jgi:hypothetical protein
MSYIGKFSETVVNRKNSRTTKFTIYDLLWNGGQVWTKFQFMLKLNKLSFCDLESLGNWVVGCLFNLT